MKFADCKESIPEENRVTKGKCERASAEVFKFCPTTRFWYYGEPLVHDNTYCTQTQECSVSQSLTHEFNEQVANGQTVMRDTQETHSIGFNLGFELGYKDDKRSAGANFGLTASVAHTMMEQ